MRRQQQRQRDLTLEEAKKIPPLRADVTRVEAALAAMLADAARMRVRAVEIRRSGDEFEAGVDRELRRLRR